MKVPPLQALLPAAVLSLALLTLCLPVRADHQKRVQEHFAAPVSSALFTIQQEISQADTPGAYYESTYQHAEPFYWWNIPGWMQADAAGHRARRILDIGCGYGTLLTLAATIYGDPKAYCVDMNVYLLPAFLQKRKLEFSRSNIELDPIPWEGGFDVIIMTEVLEHFNFQPVPTLVKIREALAPDGRFFLSTPDAKEWGKTQKYYKDLNDLPPATPAKPIVDDHIWQYNEKELRDVLQKAGFQIEKFDYAPGVGHRHFNIVARRGDQNTR